MAEKQSSLTKPEKDMALAEEALQSKDSDKLFRLFQDAQNDAAQILRAAAVIAQSKNSAPEQAVTIEAIDALREVALRAMELVASQNRSSHD